MYSKEDILKSLNADNYFIDWQALESFIANWNIDAIYEDENGLEFFDDLSISKIKKGISLKSQGYNNDQILYRIHKLTAEDLPAPIETQQAPTLNNVTVDITSQTLQMLAEAVATKLTTDIKEHVEKMIDTGAYKRDNEILSEKLEELLDDNKRLARRLELLENRKKSLWQKLFS